MTGAHHLELTGEVLLHGKTGVRLYEALLLVTRGMNHSEMAGVQLSVSFTVMIYGFPLIGMNFAPHYTATPAVLCHSETKPGLFPVR